MQFSLIATFAVALFGQAALANPIAPETTSVGSLFPVSTLELSNAVHTNTTVPSTHGFPNALLARQEFPASLLLCPNSNCASCSVFNLASFVHNQCLSVGFQFFSAAISQPSNQGLPFAVDVFNFGCTNGVQLPAVNTCFNVNGVVFQDFALTP
ncbi:hypothetical protein BD413DRAFT_472701 [Trametes elegans]|nr:hypothetical protein BD413DRAFT_472701 [Trametes elegans]